MPYVIETMWYPTDKAMEVVETYFKALKKFPPDESLAVEVVPGAVTTGRQGVEAMTILDVKEGKLEATLERCRNGMAMFMSIPGLEYSIRVHLKVEEALATVGKSLPK